LPGGKGANQALAAATAGGHTVLCGRIGGDGAGYRDGLTRRGVDCSGVLEVPDIPSGHALIAVDEHGENTIIVIPGANAAMTAAEVDRHAAAIRAAAVVVLQLEVPLPAVLRAAELAGEAGARVLLNPSPFAVPPDELLAVADPLVVNEHEAAQLPAGVARSVCVTLGERGARWGDLEVPAPAEVDVVDTTGAGDSFAGALAAALAAGSDEADALRRAVAAGSEACGWAGAQGWRL
ncbi:MAG TPA: PfkB family carbohydrate kinase, partial [Pseudonocardiaceae bacterium]|nr:PfkB family carbohydrate kinase [Pseudonocardiaceae bacterium]